MGTGNRAPADIAKLRVEVFDRDASFDPAVDAIVRVGAARLRAKLRLVVPGRRESMAFSSPTQ